VDDLELLAGDEVHALTCEVCACRFHLALFECGHCGEETVFVKASVPTPAEIRAATCRHCGHPLNDDEQDVPCMGRA
jgi:formate dehydrogenase maturation protein FdhE